MTIEWVLVVFLVSGWNTGGVATMQIAGYATEKVCREASERLAGAPFKDRGSAPAYLVSTCVPRG